MSNNQVQKSEVMPLSEITTIGKVFADSGMFENVKSQSQAIVRILAGQEIGIPPFAAISGIHIIKGKPSMGAGLMASRLKGSGKYDYRVTEQTDKVCSIDFFQFDREGKSEKIGNSTFTLEDAKKAGTQNLEKFPRNMLFSRAMSNGVKWFTPDIFAGPVYVAEELTQITEDVIAEVTTAKPKWESTAEQMDEAETLIKNSTLDDTGKATATNSLANAKSQAGWDKVINRLKELQHEPV